MNSGQEDDASRYAGRALEHAWQYFELHSKQRLTTFNFFLFLSGAASAGVAAALQGSAHFAILGVALGLLLILASFLFWKLDQRTSFLIKHAEACITSIETACLPEAARVFSSEPSRLLAAQVSARGWRRIWTYGLCFRISFLVMAAVGASGAGIALLRYCGLLSWN